MTHDDLIQRAREARRSRPSIGGLRDSVPSRDVAEGAIGELVEAGHYDAALRVVAGAALAGHPVDAGVIGRIAWATEDVRDLFLLAGACSGDVVGALLDAVMSNRMSEERDALAVAIAAALADDKSRATVAETVRIVGRRPFRGQAQALMAAAIRDLDDPALYSGGGLTGRMAQVLGPHALESTRERLAGDLLADIPSSAPRSVVSGRTVRNEQSVGRNDPCPCGSGKKFKKCCLGRSAADRSEARVADLNRGDVTRQLTRRQFERLRPHEMAALDRQRLPNDYLVIGMRTLSARHMWDEVLAFADELRRRDDLPHERFVDDLIDEALHDAMRAGDAEATKRLSAAISGDDDRRFPPYATWFADSEAMTVAELDGHCRDALDDPIQLVELAHSALAFTPALGIVVARGAIDPDQLLDADVLATAVEDARARVGLPPDSVAREIVEVLYDEADRQWNRQLGERVVDAVESHARKELTAVAARRDEARQELQRARAELGELSRQAARKRRAIAAVEGLAGETPAANETNAGAPHVAQDELRTLRVKARRLEAEIRERNTERRELRRQFAELRAELDSRPASRDASPAEGTEGEDAAVESTPAARPLGGALIPVWERGARRGLDDLESDVVSAAVRLVGALGARGEDAWSGVKALARGAGVYSARVGRAHRLLFRCGDGELEVLALILRRDLERTLDRILG